MINKGLPTVSYVNHYKRLLKSIKKFFKRINHVLEYLPLLWQDRHWDYGFLYSLMDFKLQKMEDTIRSNDLILDLEKVCKSIRVYRKLLKRSNDEDWHYNLQNTILERKWGKIIHWRPSEVNPFREDFEVYPGCYRWYFIIAPEKVLKEGTYPKFKKDKLAIYKRAEKKSDEDLRKAFKVFRKYHKTWWD